MTTWVRRRPELIAILAVLPALVLLPGDKDWGVYGLGVVQGSVLALNAAGMVLVFRSNRFLNFAQVSIGAVAGTLFAVLVNAQPMLRGVRAMCPPCLEQISGRTVTVNYWLSLVVALAAAVLLSWLVYVGIVRRLDRAPRLVATVASVFLITLLAGLQRGIVNTLSTEQQRLKIGITTAVPPPVHASFHVGQVRFGLPEVLLVVVAVLGLLGIAIYLRRSTTGTAIRAASENTARAQTLGVDVAHVTGRIWMLVGALSGSASVLLAMSAPAGDGTGGGIGVGLLAAVLIVVVLARLVSLPMVALGALAVGVLSAAVQFSVRNTDYLLVSLLGVVLVLLLVQTRDAGRADTDSASSYLTGRQARPVPRELAAVPSVRTLLRSGLVSGTVVVLVLPFVLSPSQTSTVTTTVLYAVVGMSLLVLTGWAGLVSLGQFAFAAVGAWAAASSGLPFLLAVPLGAVTGALAAVLIGLPALRLRPLTLGITTLLFAAAVPSVLLNRDALGGALPDELSRPLVLGVSLDSQRAFYFTSVVVLAVVVLAVVGLRRSRTARVLLAARDNEAAAQSFGIPVLRARLQAFAMSGGIAGLAGALFAYQQAGVKTESFGIGASLFVFSFTVIGGLGSIGGPVAGFTVLGILSLTLSKYPTWFSLAVGLGGVVLLLVAPGGIAQLLVDLRDGLLRRIARRNGIAVPSLDRARATEERVAPILPKTGPRGGAVFVPRRYALTGDWAVAARRRAEGLE
ncbi:MAG: branched-chain amino acid transport system permease protein livM [Actinomycetota bacterium]|jgi:branched-chain amino acid transport system permease protein|nr:branched-chain amino acid transport system permease protein livM [Actinomycetota bacterium]